MKISPLDEWICRKISVPSGRLTEEAISSYQLGKLNDTLHHSQKNSRFYNQHLNRMPERIRTLQEFEQFPFTTAEDLRQQSTDMICVPQGEISRIVTLQTSGTTGKPKRVFFTPADQELTIDFFGVGMSTLVDETDRVLILLPDSTPGSVGDLLYTGLLRIGAHPVKHGPVIDLEKTLSLINREEITGLVGVPTQILALCHFFRLHHENYPVMIKSLLLSTDHVPEAIVKQLQSTWNCHVFNHYGMTEMGLGGGVFCEANHGYHLREADMLFEIIDPLTGMRMPDGEYGELVFTTLTRIGMPLIRYRTGDQSRFFTGTCPCTSKLKSLERISKRINEKFLLNRQEVHLSDMDELFFSCDNVIDFRMEVEHLLKKDRLLITLYSLQPIIGFSQYQKILHSFLENRNIKTGQMEILFDSVCGFPSDLASMRKRKVIEHIH